MTSRIVVLPIGFGLSAVLCLRPAGAEEPAAPRPRPPARVYTNEDLDRVRPFRDEVGGRSVPAVTAEESRAEARASHREGTSSRRTHDEAWWREEARKARERVEAIRAQADELRARIAAAEEERRHVTYSSRGGSKSRAGRSGASDAADSARLAGLERRARSIEDELHERARREGALPGWLR
jgi:predicted RNase H-like nuclease (RuvC/YqgF family)